MEFLSSSQTAAVTAVSAFVIFVFSLFFISTKVIRKRSKKRAAPQAGGAWPVIGHLHLLGGPEPAHRVLGNMADKYGPIFTVKMGVHQALVVSNWEIAKECLTTNDKVFANRPKTIAMELLGYNSSMFGFSPYGPYWRQARKIATLELLSNHRLEKLKHVRESEMRTSVKELYEVWSKNKSSGSNKVLVDMKRWFGDVTLNVILKLIVGKRLRGSEGWKEELTNFFEWSGKFLVSDALPFLRWLDIGGDEKSMKETAKKLDMVVQGWLEEHKKKRASGEAKEDEDFMDVMITILQDDPQLFPGRDADTVNKAICLNMILAASDTTTVTLTWVLTLLLNHPDVLKKAQHELDIHVGSERQFKPERFLTTHKDFDVRGNNHEYTPFSSGRRMCPGVSFALQVLQLTLASLIHGFDFETQSNEAVDTSEGIGLTYVKASPLEVLLSPRLSPSLYA
ncbi:hypothetical protein Q3G72_012857 [Acer saccharum]|nr:hypothetical protein Q3G72_012857 [Acer saccharum]